MTPGQAAYEAYATTLCDLAGVSPESRKPSRWDAPAPQDMRPNERAAWEDAAQAAAAAVITADRDAWRERAAELLAEVKRLRALLAEILPTYAETPSGHSGTSAISVVTPARHARWHKAAGLGNPETASEGTYCP